MAPVWHRGTKAASPLWLFAYSWSSCTWYLPCTTVTVFSFFASLPPTTVLETCGSTLIGSHSFGAVYHRGGSSFLIRWRSALCRLCQVLKLFRR